MYRNLTLLFYWALPFPLFADTLWLSNGDQLSGSVILLDGGTLVFDSSLAGRVYIDWRNVATISTDKPLMLQHDGLDSQLQSGLFASASGTVKLNAEGSASIPLASIIRLHPPAKLVKDLRWQGKLDVKADLRSGEQPSKNWNLKGETRIEHNRWRHVVDGQSERNEKDRHRTDDLWELGYKLDYFFHHHWFVRASDSYSRSYQDEQERQRETGIGPGYRFWDNTQERLELYAQFTRASLNTTDSDLRFNTLGLGWDFKHTLWGSRVEATSKGNLYFPQIKGIDYLFSSDYGLSYRLNDWARLSLIYELEQISVHRHSNPDHHYMLGVGVKW